MLKNTMTTKECLHRFCSDCIVTALRSGNKECPTCRKKLVSKRSLRPDPNFDALISKIYPSRDEYEAHQDRVLAKLSRLHNQQALSSSIEEGLKMQAMHRGKGSPQRDLERWPWVNLMRFKMVKCRVLHLGEDNPKHGHRLGLKGWRAEKDLGGEEVAVRWQRVVTAQEANISWAAAEAVWPAEPSGLHHRGQDSSGQGHGPQKATR
ncbi:hypothetical protein llap_21947 [Limosa lapponica baueri]|uniref:RING-type E3 ubiquitin transferase n=1 Tax=Limosa lapponica baueri TaxID=1758121 RepID=A0A2I0T1V3_LIMLA|nr:hypothetical protein llap_21947 [Limosa lapponica baueri]